ncbi:hypothetical protein, partial [Streptomyces afghaniensis]|uniref:hypothetical protein n=1 Tax=Streptomyces afghaniensis TaxID=66865 RepID=UPI0005661F84
GSRTAATGQPRARSQPRAAIPGDDGIHTVALVIDEDQHRTLAEYCRIMLRRLQERYHARAQAR